MGRDLRQEDIICGCLPYWYLFQPFFYEKTWLNRDTEWFGRSLEPYWSDRPLKTTCRRVRGYWTTNRCCLVKYLLPQNSVEREIESQTGRSGHFISSPGYLKKKKVYFVRLNAGSSVHTLVFSHMFSFAQNHSLKMAQKRL